MTNNTTAALTDEQREAARKRVSAYLDAYSTLGEIDQTCIHAANLGILLVADLRALLTSPRAARVPEGWKLVPIERSYNMRAKALIAFNTTEKKTNDRDDALDAAHRAMLDAAPAAPVTAIVMQPLTDAALREALDDFELVCENNDVRRLTDDEKYAAQEFTLSLIHGDPSATQAVAADGAQSWHHELKTDPDVFAAVLAGDKTHEIRYNDRGFKVGDTLRLRETRYSGESMKCQPDDYPLEYTGREVTRVISHVLDGYGLMPGWVVLSFASERAAVSPATADTTWKAPKQHCQNGGDVCLAGNRDGVCCPEDSCDIDDGTRKNPATADERAAFKADYLRRFGKQGRLGWDAKEGTFGHALVRARWEGWQARASQAAAPADARSLPDDVQDTLKLAIGYIGSSERADRHEHVARIQAILVGAAPAEAREPSAWVTPEGDRSITQSQKQGMLRDGGAGASSVQPFSIACYAGRIPADAGEAVASIENPLTPYGMLVRALRMVAGTTLMEMATGMGVSPAFLSSLEFGRRPVTYDNAAFASGFFSDMGIVDTLPALAHAVGLSQGAQGGKGGEA
ncbi:DUF3850 domain-containing protein [Burkholderia gladioli]|uniref:DUF3850 domain-containing protein n=1 Tax=Burkholderia gladioli TaxID=28095 RepID=UPI001ABB38DF|nr:DUF3850 domain-containing protein [Burkholderia gladioli]